jgi:hypothetical protein
MGVGTAELPLGRIVGLSNLDEVSGIRFRIGATGKDRFSWTNFDMPPPLFVRLRRQSHQT